MKLLILIIIILLSTNHFTNGQSGWFRQFSNTNVYLNDVFFIDNQKGWIAADDGGVLRTTNAGVNWEVQDLSHYGNFYSIHFINENTGWAVGGDPEPPYPEPINVSAKTTNGGINWVSGYGFGFQNVDIYFINPNTGFHSTEGNQSFVSSGALSRTSDGGSNWQTIEHGRFIFGAVEFLNLMTGWAAGYCWTDTNDDSIIIIKTTNSGLNWFTQYKEYRSSYLHDLDISITGSHVWVAFTDSKLLHSSDSGNNWIVQETSFDNSLKTIFFINEQTGWAAGYRNPDTTSIFKTTNGGVNWFRLIHPYAAIVNSIYFLDQNTGWAVCSNGAILKTITGGLTSAAENSSTLISSFKLYQNYPNPFNPKTTIKYSIESLSDVTLKVYNLLGNEVETLVNGKMNAGNYEVEFDAGDHSSGIYFYELNADGLRIGSKRMVVVK